MKILVLFAHPVESSFGAALHAKAVETLEKRGHEIDDCDLYGENFDPVMSRQDRLDYHDVSINRRRVAPYVDRLLAAEALLFSFPVWNFGFPAISQRFCRQGVLARRQLQLERRRELYDVSPQYPPPRGGVHLWRIAPARNLGGRSAAQLFYPRDARRLQARRPCDYIACYDMNHTTPRRWAAFLAEVERRLTRW